MKKEEEMIIELSRGGDGVISPIPAGFDWGYLFRTGRANRLLGTIFDGLDRHGRLLEPPPSFLRRLEEEYLQQVGAIRSALDLASDLAARFAAAGVDLLFLRGVALGLTVYPRPFLRPFSDLDLLVPRSELAAAKEIIRAAGFQKIPGIFPDRYFQRHHLHLGYLHPPTGWPLELHWAFDHPYTLSRIEYPVLFSQRRKAPLQGRTIPVLSPADRIITLSCHLFKHCPFLPELLREKEFLHLILRGRWLLWLLDIHRTLTISGGEIDGEKLISQARRWNLLRETATCLRAVALIYGDFPGRAPLPIPGKKTGSVFRRELYRRQRLYLNDRRSAGRLTRSLFRLQAGSIFRPVRLLDLTGYLFPGAAWLKERYRVRGVMICPAAAGHAVRGIWRLLVNLLDYLYYRFRRW